MKRMWIILLFVISYIGLYGQSLDSVDFVIRLDHSPNTKTTGCSLYESLGHWYLRLPESSHHHESCPHYMCKARRRAQYISDSLMIHNDGIIYKLGLPLEIGK